MKLGMIGLGRMGANMARRLMRDGHSCVVHDRLPAAVNALANEGALGATTLDGRDPIFASLAPGAGAAAKTPGREGCGGTAEKGYLYCGPNGAGHFVTMVHNGNAYGMMAAYAKGLN